MTPHSPGAHASSSAVVAPKRRLLAYAFGPGFDHVVRVAAVLRRLTRYRDVEAHILTNHTVLGREAYPNFTFYECPMAGKSIVPKLRELIIRVKPMLFLVDGFPKGIYGELPEVLPDFPCPCVLLQQALAPVDQARGNLPDFVNRHYEITIAARDALAYPELGRALQVEPLCLYDHDEFLDEVDAKLELGYAGRPICVFQDSAPGGVRLYELLRKQCDTINGLRVEWRLHTNDTTISSRFPEKEILHGLGFAHLMRGIRLVVTAAGYSSYHEALAMGVPTLWMPVTANQHDLQQRRVGPMAISDPKRLVISIKSGQIPDSCAPLRFNGATVAARYIRQLIGFRHARPDALFA